MYKKSHMKVQMVLLDLIFDDLERLDQAHLCINGASLGNGACYPSYYYWSWAGSHREIQMVLSELQRSNQAFWSLHGSNLGKGAKQGHQQPTSTSLTSERALVPLIVCRKSCITNDTMVFEFERPRITNSCTGNAYVGVFHLREDELQGPWPFHF